MDSDRFFSSNATQPQQFSSASNRARHCRSRLSKRRCCDNSEDRFENCVPLSIWSEQKIFVTGADMINVSE